MVACSSLLGIDCDKILINICMVKALKLQSTLLQFAKLHVSPQTLGMYKWRTNKTKTNWPDALCYTNQKVTQNYQYQLLLI
jgi:hypothetical protein